MNKLDSRHAKSPSFSSHVGRRLAESCYFFLWKNVVNWQGRIMWFFYKKPTHVDKPFLKDGARLLVANKVFSELAHYVKKNTQSELLDSTRRSIHQDESVFTMCMFKKLDKTVRKQILQYCLHQELIDLAASHLGVMPRLAGIQLNLNVPREHLGAEGSKLWHRDAYMYKMLDICIAISDITPASGPLSVVKPSALDRHAVIERVAMRDERDPWKRQRNTDDEMFKHVDPDDVISLIGPTGTALLLDACAGFHKGGHCEGDERLMLRITYCTDDGVLPHQTQSALAYFDLEQSDITNAGIPLSRLNKFILGLSMTVGRRDLSDSQRSNASMTKSPKRETKLRSWTTFWVNKILIIIYSRIANRIGGSTDRQKKNPFRQFFYLFYKRYLEYQI